MLKDSSEKAVTATSEIKMGTATFADNVLTLAGGTTIALTVTVLASPITSRLFGPEAFGLAALFRSGAMMLAAIACLRYEMAIVLPKKNEDAASLFALCCIVLVAMTIFVSVLTKIFGNLALVYLNADGLRPMLWLFPVYVFLMGSQLPLRLWYTRQKQFKTNAVGSILGSFPISIAEITGGWAGFQTGADLIIIRILGLIFTPAFFVWKLFGDAVELMTRSISLSVIIRSAKKYIKFPMLDIWSILIAHLGVMAPILLLTVFFSPAICGLYSKAMYLLYVPSLIIGNSVGHVFLQESAAAKASGKNLGGMVEMVLNRMITLGTCPFALLLIISPELFGVFLGARWTESGVYSQILVPQLFLGFLMGSITTLFGTLGKQELNLISNAVGLTLRLATLTIGGLILRDVRLTLFIFMMATVLIGLWRMSLLIRATKASTGRLLAHLWRCVAYALPSILSIAAMKWLFWLEAVYLVVLTPIFSIPYVVLALRFDPEFRNLFSKYFRRGLSFKR